MSNPRRFWRRIYDARIDARRLKPLRMISEPTIADRIHLFTHRIGIVLFWAVLIFPGIKIIVAGYKHTDSQTYTSLSVIIVFVLMNVAYVVSWLSGWVLIALFDGGEGRTQNREKGRMRLISLAAIATIFAALFVWFGFDVVEEAARHNTQVARERVRFECREQLMETCRGKRGWDEIICVLELPRDRCDDRTDPPTADR